MTITTKLVPKREPIQKPPMREVVESVTCDRCGEDGKCGNASAERGWFSAGPWGVVRGLIQGGGDYSADLCRACTDDLKKWIDAGSGEGAQVR